MKFEDLRPGLRIEIRDNLDRDESWYQGVIRSIVTKDEGDPAGPKVYAIAKWDNGTTSSFIHKHRPDDLARVRLPAPADSPALVALAVARVADAIGLDFWFPGTRPDLDRCVDAIKAMVAHIKVLRDELNGVNGVRKQLESANALAAHYQLAASDKTERDEARRGCKELSERFANMTKQAEVNMGRYRALNEGVRAVIKRIGAQQIRSITPDWLHTVMVDLQDALK